MQVLDYLAKPVCLPEVLLGDSPKRDLYRRDKTVALEKPQAAATSVTDISVSHIKLRARSRDRKSVV